MNGAVRPGGTWFLSFVVAFAVQVLILGFLADSTHSLATPAERRAPVLQFSLADSPSKIPGERTVPGNPAPPSRNDRPARPVSPKKSRKPLATVSVKPLNVPSPEDWEASGSAPIGVSDGHAADSAPPSGREELPPGTRMRNAAAPSARDKIHGYIQTLHHELMRRKRYPARAKAEQIEGTPVVEFSVDRQGRPVAIEVRGGAPGLLQKAARDIVSRAPFARPPDEWETSARVEIPISFRLR